MPRSPPYVLRRFAKRLGIGVLHGIGPERSKIRKKVLEHGSPTSPVRAGSFRHEIRSLLHLEVIRSAAMAIRCQGVLLIVALLAVPLALLVRGIACDTSGMICCSSHGPSSQSQKQGMLCGRRPAGHAPMCGTKSGHQPLDYGFIAPMAPTAPEALVVLAAPSAARQSLAFDSQSELPGFRSAPFEPPRS